ncbi:spore germination protein [Mesobacillus maritimus]|uniref:spore germination protein n=1 Tax=Mesobacillus maritimus TaxID=1643336 RepID=UPI0038500001
MNQERIEKLLSEPFKKKLSSNVNQIETILKENDDLVKREFTLRLHRQIDGICLYIDGLSTTDTIDSAIETFMYKAPEIMKEHPFFSVNQLPNYIKSHILYNQTSNLVSTFREGITSILAGDSMIILDGYDDVLILASRGWNERSVEEPQTEQVVRGPREGFTENIRSNTALVRRKVQTPYFSLKSLEIGKKTKTSISIAYIRGTVKEGLIEEIQSRLKKVKLDGVMDSGYIEELIADGRYSPFTTIQGTERPDKVASALLEGKAAVFVDNSPFVLIMPSTFWEYIQASDDYYSNYMLGTFYRLVRLGALIISLVLPSLYVMLVSFHQEMIPTTLALTIASGREVVPFPVLVEALLMELAFELIREGGLRMPKPIGQAVSIVGSLIIGQAAVQAGVVSPFMVIVIAITGIASFSIPNYAASFSIRLLRFPLLIISGTLGLLGFAAAFTLLLVHALSLRSFGEPFLSPMVPFRANDQKDSILRFPWWTLKRPAHLAEGEDNRENDQS